jgi:hypothetical protein
MFLKNDGSEGLIGKIRIAPFEEDSMGSCGCTKAEKKVKDPKKCSPEQIAECHPAAKEHPCEE